MPRAAHSAKIPGKRLVKPLPELARVEVDAAPLLLAVDRARHHVARRELGVAVLLEHEPRALLVDEDRPFAAHRLGDQRERVLRRVERGGMELHELHVGERHAGAVRDGVAVARGDHRVGRVAEDLAAATRREHGRVGDDLHRLAGHARAHAERRAPRHDEVQHARPLEHADPLARPYALDERARDLGAGLVAVRVHDAVRRVRRLAAELELAARVEVELGARRLQLAHAGRPLLHQHLDRRRVAQRRTRGERVAPVERRRVPRAERRRDAPLRIRGRAVEQRPLRQQEDVTMLRGAPRGVQAGDATADDEEAGADAVGGGHGGNQTGVGTESAFRCAGDGRR